MDRRTASSQGRREPRVGSASSRPRTVGGSSRQPREGRGAKTQTKTGGAAGDLLSREEEYMRINAELEARTANLVREAEAVMKDQEDLLLAADAPLSPRHGGAGKSLNLSDFFNQGLAGGAGTHDDFADDGDDVDDYDEAEAAASRRGPASSATGSRPASRRSAASSSRPTSQASAKSSSRARPGSAASSTSSGAPRPSKKAAASGAVGKKRAGGAFENDEVMAAVMAGEMGDEATLRFLKAKVRVLQEEHEATLEELHNKTARINELETKLKKLRSNNEQANKSQQNHQQQIEALTRQLNDVQRKHDAEHAACNGLRKELDLAARAQKQASSDYSALEVRFNRAQEQVDKLRHQLDRSKASRSESGQQQRARLDELETENKLLQKQKTELILAFKKQLALIDILRRQKLHVEAAKMLSFSEEEFVKALDWGAS